MAIGQIRTTEELFGKKEEEKLRTTEQLFGKPSLPAMPVRRELELGDWKKELPGAIKETWEELPAAQLGKKKYWIEAGKNLSKGISGFLQAITGMPGRQEEEEARLAAMKKVGGERPSPVKVAGMIGKEVGEMGFEFVAFLPKIAIALAKDPIKEVRDNPLGVGLLVASVVGVSGARIRSRVKTGKPILKQDMAKAIDSIPESILTKKQKAKIKPALPEQMEIPFESIPELALERKSIAAWQKQIAEKKAIDKAKYKTTMQEQYDLMREMEDFQEGRPPFKKAPIEKLEPDTMIIGEIERLSKLRKQQEVLYAKERGRRFAEAQKVGKEIRGEAGFYAEKSKLGGELPKIKADPKIFSQEKVDNLFITVANSPRLHYLESLSAREGLLKLLGKKEGLPTNKQIEHLGKVFPKGITEAVVGKPGKWETIKQYALEATNVPRAIMAAYDLSFLGRQGIFVAARHPIIWLRAFIKQFKMFGVEKTYQTLMEEIRSRPTYDLMVNGDAIFGKEFRHKVALTERGEGVPLKLREEAFMGAELAEKIPIVGLGVKASNRAYTGTGNRLRADLFDSMIKRAKKLRRNPYKEPKMVEGIIKLVNAATGRGNLLESIKSSAPLLNATLFSPRLISSRLSLLNPKFYLKLEPLARREALESLFSYAGLMATTLGIAKLAGAEVEMQLNPFKPISADWGKIKIGNTRIDIMGGFQQYIRTAFQFISGKVVSTTTGKVTEAGKGYKPITRLGIALRPLEYKLAPVASFAVGLIRGRTAIGEPFETPKEIAGEVGKRFIPMVMQDVADLIRDDPGLLGLAGFGFFGLGLQTYKPRKKKEMVVY